MSQLTEEQKSTLTNDELHAYNIGEAKKFHAILEAIQDLPDVFDWPQPEHEANRESYYRILENAMKEAKKRKDHIPDRFLKRTTKK